MRTLRRRRSTPMFRAIVWRPRFTRTIRSRGRAGRRRRVATDRRRCPGLGMNFGRRKSRMSFTVVAQCTPRLHRSELAVPGSSPQFFEKAARSASDVVFLDLEDAVAPDQKVEARKNIVQALHEVDWGSKTLTVRINGLDTPYMYRDVIDV